MNGHRSFQIAARRLAFTLTCVVLALAWPTAALAGVAVPVTITIDENGVGTVELTGGSHFPLPASLKPDPGPGGLPAALTYDLSCCTALTTGDVFIMEPGTDIPSDLIRFNPFNGSEFPFLLPSLVFYSDIFPGDT